MTKNNKRLDVKEAYGLKTPQDSINLYRRWAKSYDQDFARINDYNNPAQVADAFTQKHTADNVPILDVGAGTGLVGQRLAENGLESIHAIDISPEMLEQAKEKGCYSKSILADLSQPLDLQSEYYGGIICAGTFTFGHVGPDAIDELMRIARPNALFTLGINAKIFDSGGFSRKFDELSEQITDFEILTFKTYGEKASKEMQAGRSSVAVFRKK